MGEADIVGAVAVSEALTRSGVAPVDVDHTLLVGIDG